MKILTNPFRSYYVGQPEILPQGYVECIRLLKPQIHMNEDGTIRVNYRGVFAAPELIK